MADYADELRKLNATLYEAQREINLAREQSTKPEHLFVRARRAAVQAAKAVAAAVDLGFSEIWPNGWWVLSALRKPDDPDRPPATIQVGDFKAQMRSIKLGSGCNPDGALRDDTAFAIWVQHICPVMRSKQTTSKADAGAFDFPSHKTDEQGRVLGRDGKPMEIVVKTDPETGEPIGSEWAGPAATVADDYDEADAMEHLRCQAADWVDACEAAICLIRKESLIAKWKPKLDDAARALNESMAGFGSLDDLSDAMAKADRGLYRPGGDDPPKPKPAKPKSQREKLREQRNKFSKSRRKRGKTWEQIYTEYREKYPKDTKASPATLRLSYERNKPKD
jgi:hypothetical protein